MDLLNIRREPRPEVGRCRLLGAAQGLLYRDDAQDDLGDREFIKASNLSNTVNMRDAAACLLSEAFHCVAALAATNSVAIGREVPIFHGLPLCESGVAHRGGVPGGHNQT